MNEHYYTGQRPIIYLYYLDTNFYYLDTNFLWKVGLWRSFPILSAASLLDSFLHSAALRFQEIVSVNFGLPALLVSYTEHLLMYPYVEAYLLFPLSVSK